MIHAEGDKNSVTLKGKGIMLLAEYGMISKAIMDEFGVERVAEVLGVTLKHLENPTVTDLGILKKMIDEYKGEDND